VLVHLQAAGSKGFSEFSGVKSTNAVTFGKRSDDLASIVAAQSAVVGLHFCALLVLAFHTVPVDDIPNAFAYSQ
jgi:hypothetical protein